MEVTLKGSPEDIKKLLTSVCGTDKQLETNEDELQKLEQVSKRLTEIGAQHLTLANSLKRVAKGLPHQ